MAIWDLYEYPPSFVIGFHGCSTETGEAALAENLKHLKPSKKKYDWLGHGIYFWEGNPQRALEWAKAHHENPFVLGAILDLGHCLDLMDSSGLQQVKDSFAVVHDTYQKAGFDLPENKGKDNGARILDCLVINSLHRYRDENSLIPYDTVRAMFPEGEDLYAGAGFGDKNHIQICVRDTACIKGYFRPIRLA